jgi:AraC-like DNA-binding protein
MSATTPGAIRPDRDLVPFRKHEFSTDHFPEHQRVEAYREIYGRTIVRHDIQPLGDRPFRFEATLCTLPGLGLAASHFSPCRRSHGGQHNVSDDLVLGIGVSGACVVWQRSREAAVDPGEAVLTTSADPAVVLIGAASQAISVRVPTAVLGAVDLDATLARTLPRDNAGLRLLTGYVGAIWRMDAEVTPTLRDLVIAHVHDLVLLALGAKGDARQLAEARGGQAARRDAVLRAIAKSSGDPRLSAVAVAHALGISSRYLHLLLEGTGQSFTHHLLATRLDNAAALLRDPRRYGRRIGEIAQEAGFTDLSHFSRAFRRRFGMTPSDVREVAMRGIT